MITAPIKVEERKFYMNPVFGVFVVRRVKDSGILATIVDSYGNVKKTSFASLNDCIEIDKAVFDGLFTKHCGKPLIRHGRYYVLTGYGY